MILAVIYDYGEGRFLERCEDEIVEEREYELRNSLAADVYEFESVSKFLEWNYVFNYFSAQECLNFFSDILSGMGV